MATPSSTSPVSTVTRWLDSTSRSATTRSRSAQADVTNVGGVLRQRRGHVQIADRPSRQQRRRRAVQQREPVPKRSASSGSNLSSRHRRDRLGNGCASAAGDQRRRLRVPVSRSWRQHVPCEHQRLERCRFPQPASPRIHLRRQPARRPFTDRKRVRDERNLPQRTGEPIRRRPCLRLGNIQCSLSGGRLISRVDLGRSSTSMPVTA